MSSANFLPTASPAALLDATATKAIEFAAPIAVRAAQTLDEVCAAYRLRYQAIVERGWARPEDFPDGLERDGYDEHTIQILAWDGDAAVATARVVLPAPGVRLPTEAAFDLVIEPQGRFADWGRYVVHRAYSNSQHRIFAALVGQCWLEGRARGFELMCGNAPQAMLRLYRRIGLKVTVLGPARRRWGEERYPFYFDPERTGTTIIAHWDGLRDKG